MRPPSGNGRASLLVTVRDKPGALYDVLNPFAKHDVSMNHLESRPAHTGKWQYAFSSDVPGHIEVAPRQAALRDMGPIATQVRMLGSCPVAQP